TMGQGVAWIIGWDLILEYGVAAVSVAIGWSGYVVSFLRNLGIVIPPHWATGPLTYDSGTGWALTGALLNVPAMLIVLIVSGLLAIGTRESARVNDVIVVIKLAVVIAFIAVGIGAVDHA